MRRFFALLVLLLFSIPFGVSLSGCSKTAAPTFCNGGDTGITTGQATTITLQPVVYGLSLNFAEIGQVNPPAVTDCKGSAVAVSGFTFGTTSMALADVQPTTGRICAGTWNRNSGGGIADYTYCIPTNQSGTAYISASADGVTSNPLPVFVHPLVTSIVLGGPSTGGAASITAWSIVNNPTPQIIFTAQNSYSAGQVLSLSRFPVSTFFNGINNATVLAAGLSSTQFTVTIPGFSQPNGSAVESGLAIGPGCSTNPSTDCCPLATPGSPVAPPYQANSCLSQGTTTQLIARVFAGTGASQTNISCFAGHLQYSAQGATSTTQISPVVSIDPNGVATANQPGSVLISANLANAASSAGFFSTCPPASIALTAPGATTNPVVVNENNPQPLQATAVDTNGVTLTGLSLEYVSTSPTTIPAPSENTNGVVTPSLAGAASISAICLPPSCNPSAYNQIGLLGNGKPITSNAVNISAPGTNSTVLIMASTQSQYMEVRDFTQNAIAPPFVLPYIPNSMFLSNDGSTLYMGSSSALMVVNAVNALSLTRIDTSSTGTVIGLSPDGTTVVLSDPVRQVITLENSSGSTISTYGGVGTHAAFSPDSQTIYITAGSELLVYSGFTGWTSITPATSESTPVTDAAVTVPSVGAYFAGQNTTARGYCPISTPITIAGTTTETNVFYPLADDTSTENVYTDRIAATNDGLHILGATVNQSPKLYDLRVQIPAGNTGASVSIACPTAGGLAFSHTTYTTSLSPITATSITGVLPTSDSSLAFITYTGAGGVLPAYAPALNGKGTTTYIPLSGSAIAPLAGVISADNATVFVGTSGDNLVHLINRATLTDCALLPAGSCLGSSSLNPNSSILAPNLISPTGTVVPVNLIVQKPRRTT